MKQTNKKAHNLSASIKTIRRPGGDTRINFREIYYSRHLLLALVWRDIKVRYRHTTLGVLWFILQPLVLMLVISAGLRFIVPGKVDGLPYPVYVTSGLVLWIYFSSAFPAGSVVLESYSNLVNKVYFPKIWLPLIPCLTGIVDMLAASLLLIPIFWLYDLKPSWRVIFIPLILFFMMLMIYGMSLLASACSARYKDLRLLIPFLNQILFFASPVFFPPQTHDSWLGLALALNPLISFLMSFRWALFLEASAPNSLLLCFTLIQTVFLLIVGLVYFQRQQSTLADIL